MKAGQYIFNGPEVAFTMRELIDRMRDGWLDTVVDIWYNNMLGLVVWLAISIPVGFLVYWYSLPIFKRYYPGKEEIVSKP